jgi:hypothetical protein
MGLRVVASRPLLNTDLQGIPVIVVCLDDLVVHQRRCGERVGETRCGCQRVVQALGATRGDRRVDVPHTLLDTRFVSVDNSTRYRPRLEHGRDLIQLHPRQHERVVYRHED